MMIARRHFIALASATLGALLPFTKASFANHSAIEPLPRKMVTGEVRKTRKLIAARPDDSNQHPWVVLEITGNNLDLSSAWDILYNYGKRLGYTEEGRTEQINSNTYQMPVRGGWKLLYVGIRFENEKDFDERYFIEAMDRTIIHSEYKEYRDVKREPDERDPKRPGVKVIVYSAEFR